jgi:aminomethyltransferase
MAGPELSEDGLDGTTDETLKQVPLHALHVALGARMVPFAGWSMPVQYPTGIIAEHNHTRSAASLFDVSHMGQVSLRGPDPAAALERLVPGDIRGLALGRMRYTQLTNDKGGIIDDLMATNAGDHLSLVINASRREADLAHLQANLPDCSLDVLDRALLALQGPGAAAALAGLAPEAAKLDFMTAARVTIDGSDVGISRSGYTGEDGFEISIARADAERIARLLLEQPGVKPAGLGARDSLRLEAGLCLYGNDIDDSTTPVEAGLSWTIGKRRRAEGGFAGAEVIQRQLADGAPRRLVGLLPDGRAPARAHAEIRGANGQAIGTVTSGGFGPTAGRPVAMGYVARGAEAPDSTVAVMIRDSAVPARIVKLPFVPHRYAKKS